MQYTRNAAQTPREPHEERSTGPTVRQTYCLAHELCELLGLDWPADRAQASALIGRLKDHRAATTREASDVPF